MADAIKNFAFGIVLTAPSPATSGTSLVLNSGQGANFAVGNAVCWPANTQPLSSNAEIVRVTAVATDTLTVTRAQEGTTAQSIAVGWQVSQDVTAGLMTQYAALSGATFTGPVTLNADPSTALEAATKEYADATIPYDALVKSLNPSAWWKLADAVGSTSVVDSSGNGYTGTVNGQSATLTTALVSGTAYTSLACTALSTAYASGANVIIQSGSNVQTFVTSASVSSGATSIPVVSQNANFSYPIGTLVTGVAFGQPGALSGTPSDTAALFDGSTGYLSTNYLGPSGHQSCFAIVKGSQANDFFVSNGGEGATYGFTLGVNAFGSLILGWYNGTATQAIGDPSVTDFSYSRFVGFTSDGTTVRLYLDGVQLASLADIGPSAATSNIAIGNFFNFVGHEVRGDMSQVALFPSALTAAQILALYNAAPKYGEQENNYVTTPTVTSGAAFTPSTTSNSMVTFQVNATTAGSYTLTMGPSTGAEITVGNGVAMVAGSDDVVTLLVPRGYRVVLTLTSVTLSRTTVITNPA